MTILTTVVVLSSCTKEQATDTFGCLDVNAVNYTDTVDFQDNSCQFLYVTEYEVYKYEDKTWDPFADDLLIKDNADIKIQISKSSSFTTVEFGSYDIESAHPDSSHLWTAPNQFQLTNSIWYWKLQDDDDNPIGDGDDYMDEGSFNAVTQGNGKYVESTSVSGNTKVRIYYDVR